MGHAGPLPHVHVPFAEQPFPAGLQSTHADPLSPQAVADAVEHAVGLLEQHPAHESGVHAHEPSVQTRPAPHAGPVPHLHTPFAQPSAVVGSQGLQVLPSTPQAPSDGGVHVPLAQHPAGHELPLQTQVPCEEHSCPVAHTGPVPQLQVPDVEQLLALVVSQAEQAWPSIPQVVTDGASQVAPTQHPPVQFDVVQPVQTPFVHVCGLGHALHDEPPVPQAAVVVPASQRLLVSQQPLGHEDTLQTQTPFEQICPATHAARPPQVQDPDAEHPSAVMPQELQLAPPAPHVDADGEWHALPAQHPVGHDEALHTQAPPTQACPAVHAGPDPQVHAPPWQPSALLASQAVQTAPADPHVASDGVVTHDVPLQQPPGHEVAVQTQVPPEQTCPEAQGAPGPHEQSPIAEQLSALVTSQATHPSPPNPHAPSERALHVGPEQHPVAHVAAHPLHVPEVQLSPPGQLWHAVPPLPQAPMLLPGSQSAPAQHPVGQDTPSQTHVPFRQRCPVEQAAPVPQVHAPAVQLSVRSGSHAVHVEPATPQAVRDAGVHVRPSQHPSGHEVASQVQTPFAQCWLGPQGAFAPHWQTPALEHVSAATGSHATQVAPLAPQVPTERTLHVVPAQQPPTHEVPSQTHSPARQR